MMTNVALTRGAQEDVDMLIPLLDATLEKYEKLAMTLRSLAVDANYASGGNLMGAARRGIEYSAPHKVEYDKKVYPISRFKYNPDGDYYTCPQGKRLNFRGNTSHLGKGP